jgi:excisionase family DNA binding protein
MVATVSMMVPEAARVLGVSVETVRRRIRAGELQGERVPTPWGWSYRVTVPDRTEAVIAQAAVPTDRETMLAAQVEDLRAMVATLTTLLQARETAETDLRRALLQARETAMPPAPARSWWARLTAPLTGQSSTATH